MSTSNKRPGTFSLATLNDKKRKDAELTSTHQDGEVKPNINPYLQKPVKPEEAIYIFLNYARTLALQKMQERGLSIPLKDPIFEVEARLGILKYSHHGMYARRVTSSGAKAVQDKVLEAFVITRDGLDSAPPSTFETGVSRSHFTHWTGAGISETNPISQGFGVATNSTSSSSASEAAQLKKDLLEMESIETVYGGYSDSRRAAFVGEHPPLSGKAKPGRMERKVKLHVMDITLPAANYDLRLTLSTEETQDSNLPSPPPGWKKKRLKRRRSYTRQDKSFVWQLDVTEVSDGDDGSTSPSSPSNHRSGSANVTPSTTYEIEMELASTNALRLINLSDIADVSRMAKQYAQQLWWMLKHMNPLSDVLDVDSYIQDHPTKEAVRLATAQCASLKRFVEKRAWQPAILSDGSASPTLPAAQRVQHFIGCMPVNFSRHNIEDVQRCERGYFLSEKTDGVRYLMIFTGTSVVLLDRSMKGMQIKPAQPGDEPMADILPSVQPGTVLDGEVVINRKFRRPVFIVFDVMCSGEEPVLHKPFSERLRSLMESSFCTRSAAKDRLFSPSEVAKPSVALPLIRKNFVRRLKLDDLLSHVKDEFGLRIYMNGDTHNHLTDGIIFQPDRPYCIGTDVHLLKWKYLDTVTIDVEILVADLNASEDDILRVGVLGEEGTVVEMTRYIKPPASERLRLEADRGETGAKIAEVGFDPETGEWYYVTMRPDKLTSNHISTVLGTLLELAESLGTNELRYRMSVPAGGRDSYRKDVRRMQKQLLDFQRKKFEGR